MEGGKNAGKEEEAWRASAASLSGLTGPGPGPGGGVSAEGRSRLQLSSAQLEASSTFDSVEKLTPQKCLIIKLRQLQ